MLALVEGRPVMERPPGGPPKPVTMGSDGIAISHDGSRLYYCPLVGRRLYSVSVDALIDINLADSQVAATALDHGEKGPSDGLESDDRGRVYATNYEQNGILVRQPDGQFQTLVHDPRVLWPDTLSVARRRLSLLHGQSTAPPGQVQRGERPAPEALRAVPRPDRRRARAAHEVKDPGPVRTTPRGTPTRVRAGRESLSILANWYTRCILAGRGQRRTEPSGWTESCRTGGPRRGRARRPEVGAVAYARRRELEDPVGIGSAQEERP